jgi:hypothetical protein
MSVFRWLYINLILLKSALFATLGLWIFASIIWLMLMGEIDMTRISPFALIALFGAPLLLSRLLFLYACYCATPRPPYY